VSVLTIIGIDPSLRRTGLARILVDPHRRAFTVDTAVRPSTGHAGATVPDRYRRLAEISRDVHAWSLPADLVVIEGPSYGSSVSASAWDRAGLWWFLAAQFLRRGIPAAVVPPRNRAKWVTGNGNADKVAVRDAVMKLWAPLWAPTGPFDDNQADALVLASMGAQYLGVLPTRCQPETGPLARCEWPT
jgi:Holliday junction resolvasome RuvABC endonuclease subunit